MPQTAWATTATATIFRPCSQGTCEMSPSSATPCPKAIMATAEGIVNPNQAANALRRPARSVPSVMPSWAARRLGQELTECDDIDVSDLIQPFAALDEFRPE